jgi:hypothetical protein
MVDEPQIGALRRGLEAKNIAMNRREIARVPEGVVSLADVELDVGLRGQSRGLLIFLRGRGHALE